MITNNEIIKLAKIEYKTRIETALQLNRIELDKRTSLDFRSGKIKKHGSLIIFPFPFGFLNPLDKIYKIKKPLQIITEPCPYPDLEIEDGEYDIPEAMAIAVCDDFMTNMRKHSNGNKSITYYFLEDILEPEFFFFFDEFCFRNDQVIYKMRHIYGLGTKL